MTACPKIPPPIRTRLHREWVASHACIACGRRGETAHHILRDKSRRGMGGKGCDSATVPLCNRCHDELHSRAGNEKRFFTERRVPNYHGIAEFYWAKSPYRTGSPADLTRSHPVSRACGE